MKAVQQSRALVTRERILNAATDLYARKGFHNTKLDDVRREAEVTSGAFFHHFQNKDDLGFAVLDRHMEKRRQLLDRIESELPEDQDTGPLNPVFRRLDAIAEMVKRRNNAKGGCIIGNLSTELSDTHAAFQIRLAECFDEMAQEFVPSLEAAQLGGVSPHTNMRDVARYIVTVIEGAIMQARTLGDAKLLPRQMAYLKESLRKSLEMWNRAFF